MVKHFLFPCSSPPGNQWCDVLGFMPTHSVSSSSVLQIIWDASHFHSWTELNWTREDWSMAWGDVKKDCVTVAVNVSSSTFLQSSLSSSLSSFWVSTKDHTQKVSFLHHFLSAIQSSLTVFRETNGEKNINLEWWRECSLPACSNT